MTVRLIVPQMMSFNQIGKSSILFSSEAPHVVGLHLIVAVFSGPQGNVFIVRLPDVDQGMNGSDDLNEENGVFFIEGTRSRSGRRFIDGAVCSAWRRGNFDTKACRCRGVTLLVADVDLCDERGIWNGN